MSSININGEMVPQTVTFRIRVHYKSFERLEAGLPETVETDFEDFCEMMDFIHKEKRRRAYKNRATAAEYRQVLTDLGREKIASDDWLYSEDRYRDAIDGTWFKV